MAGEQFAVNMHVIPLGGYDIILGVHWKTQVSHVTFDYTKKRITVNQLGRRICLEQPRVTTEVHLQLKTTEMKYHMEEAYFLVQVTELKDNHSSVQELPKGIKTLLQNYTDVFANPTGLPPRRNQISTYPSNQTHDQ